MRPYKFYNTWLDLDHVLSITPSDTHCVVILEMAFRNEPVRVNYFGGSTMVQELIDAWRNQPPK